jgi:hypothetical protein
MQSVGAGVQPGAGANALRGKGAVQSRADSRTCFCSVQDEHQTRSVSCPTPVAASPPCVAWCTTCGRAHGDEKPSASKCGAPAHRRECNIMLDTLTRGPCILILVEIGEDTLDVIDGKCCLRRLLLSHVVSVGPVDHLVNLRHLLPSSRLRTRMSETQQLSGPARIPI